MLRRLIVALTVLGLALGGEEPAPTLAAQAAPKPTCVWEPTIPALLCDGVIVNSSESASSVGAKWPPDGWVPVQLLAEGPDGQPCETTTYRPVAPGGGIPAEAINPYDGGTRDPTTYPPCPAQQGQAIDPALVAAAYWEAFPVPRPRPHIAPGWAITGLKAFLETNGQLTFERSDNTPIGGLVIRATARYYVDWGDGERTGPYSFEGRPWPDGRIVHEYIWTGEKDVVVTARWDATWQLAGRSGDLRDRDVTARIDDFPVRELQAVVRSGG